MALANILKQNSKTSLYIHWPFCKSKCPYCDFNSHVAQEIDLQSWLKAYKMQLQTFSKYSKDRVVSSIYFGGGTPSLAPPWLIAGIIEEIYRLYSVAEDVEITLEANPTSIEIEKFAELKSAGINRVSIGIQSMDAAALKFLGREHSVVEAQKALAIANKVFANYSFDLIYALPNQTLALWQKELESALKLGSKHISLYQLTIEKGTPFYSAYKKQAFTLPDDELAADMFVLTNEVCSAHGLERYEVSNHAFPGHESRHNLSYWHYDQYIGIGPGAHGRLHLGELSNTAAAPADTKGRERKSLVFSTMMIHHPNNWLDAVINGNHSLNDGMQSQHNLLEKDVLNERIMLGLRTSRGIPEAILPPCSYEDYINMAFLRRQDDHIIATEKGLMVLNSLLQDILY